MFIRKSIKCKKTCTSFALITLILALSYGTFGGCGDYDTPDSQTDTPTALITEADLKGWMDAGLVNSSGYNNVVILDISSSNTAYTTEHLTGAYYVSASEIVATRTEGVGVYTKWMVPDGEMMDTLIKRTGIGPNTTVVFVSQQNVTRSTMAYFAFRYWGFRKNRLKVLDGVMTDWKTAEPLISTDTSGTEPPSANSGYSVRQNPSLRTDLRVSFPEMIDIVEGKMPNALILQAAVPVNYASFNTGILGSVAFPYDPNVVQAGALKFQTTPTIIANLTAAGVDSTKNSVVYCNSGYMAIPVFFALDGILGWPAYYYDGGWLQWGQMIDENQSVSTRAVGLDVNSPWRTDIPTLSTGIPPTYAAPFGFVPDFVNPISFDATVNEIEEEDAGYMETGTGGGAGGGGAGGC